MIRYPGQGRAIKGRESRFSLAANFIREVRRQPMLSREEEQALAARSRAGDDAASNRLVLSHLRFVIKIARTYRSFGLPMADLVQAGTVGLIQAVRRFNPERDTRLSTYAMWWIRASIQEHVVRSWSAVRVSTTAAQKALFLHLRKFRADLADGADALGDEVAQNMSRHFGLPLRDVLSMAGRVARSDWSLNTPAGARGDGTSEEWLERVRDDRPNPEEVVAQASEAHFFRATIARAMEALDPREQVIIRRRYMDDAKTTFAALAAELGLSKERVRQLEAIALDKLRGALAPQFGAGMGI
ncbi:MAG: RNA polymerase factor sigma-32 [Proteobacteria bacterium]|nr:RNA polymerase factor sigma-32 [Pseudomonadota bacterium]